MKEVQGGHAEKQSEERATWSAGLALGAWMTSTQSHLYSYCTVLAVLRYNVLEVQYNCMHDRGYFTDVRIVRLFCERDLSG